MRARAFNAGEQVFLQGDRTTDFFGLVRGRFARIHTRQRPQESGLATALSQADQVEILEQPNMVFGELDVFLRQPQEFSVFAIDPGEVVPLPPGEGDLCQVLQTSPAFGVQTCISFARRLWQKLGCFSKLNKEEEAIDRLIASSFQNFRTVFRDLELLTAPHRDHRLLQSARQEKAFTLSQDVRPPKGNAKGASVNSAVIRPPGDADRVQDFAKGSLICKRDTFGDRL